MEAGIESRIQQRAILFAILAAALYAMSSPISKLLLKQVSPTFMASFLYLGAGIGMALVGLVRTVNGIESGEKRLTTKEIPYTVGMIVLDIAAPIFLMIGLTTATPENVSLLNNFEIVATSLIALFIFKERITKRLWSAIILITLASMILSMENTNSFSFSIGSIFVLLACTCWGLENNFTRKLSIKDPLQVVVIKGFGSGTGSLLIALAIHERVSNWLYIFAALLLGFLAYGMSIFFYIYAQRYLGAAKTSAYYAIAPFIGAGLSFTHLQRCTTLTFLVVS